MVAGAAGDSTRGDGRSGAGAAPVRPALRRVVAVAPDAFAARHWGREPLLSRAEDLPAGDGEQPFADLLTLADVDELLSQRGLRTPFLRLAKDGDLVPPRRWTSGGGAGAEVGDQVSDDALVDLLVEGTTVVLQGLHRTWPPVRALAGQLAEDLGHPVQVNAYLTPASSRGFAPHYDVHDVFVLQLAGEKRWRIHRPVHPDPLRHQPWTDRPEAVAAAAAGEPLLDVVLRPGDALYLPRGFLHAAEALGEVSAHVTIGVHPVTRYALVEALLRAAADDPALRGSLPLGVDVTDPAAMAPHVRDVVGALAASLRADSDGPSEEVIARVTAEVGDTAVRATRPAPLGPFAQAAAVEALELGTLLRRREHLRAAVRREGGRLAVVLPTKRLDLPLEVEPAVRRVLSGQPVAVRDLPGLDDTDRFVLARRLLREGVAVPVPAP